MAIYEAPTVSVVGVLLQQWYIVGSKQSGGGGDGDDPFEMVLKPNTAYLLRATNSSGGSTDAAINLYWYE